MAGRGTDILLGGNPSFMAIREMKKMNFTEETINRVNAANEVAGVEENEELDAARKTYQKLYKQFKEQTDAEQKEVLAAGGLCIIGTERHESRRIDNQLRGRATYQKLYKQFKEQTDAEQKEVLAAGGLCIIGTERHESRRIDNQLRGRAGRQGDPGSSRFYIALDDDLMRLFGSERIQGLVDKIGLEEDMPIEHKMLTKSIESAQKKVEGKNFGIRKHVLEYDDVMNKQREIIYKERRRVLAGENLQEQIQDMIHSIIEDAVSEYDLETGFNSEEFKKYMYNKFMPVGSLEDID